MKIEKAAEQIGIEPKTHYNWRDHPTKLEYKEAFNFVQQMWGDMLYGDMADDAINGQTMPIIYRGEITGYYREKNTREREILIKGLKPELRETSTINQFIGPSKINIGTPHLAQSTVIDVTETASDK